MKIFSASQIRNIDKYTIEKEPVPSIDLMERAAAAFVNWFCEKFCFKKKVLIFCGLGNNGGDGLAAARMLLERDKQVEVYIVKHGGNSSRDHDINRIRLEQCLQVNAIVSEGDIPDIDNDAVIIDAIFGSGLSRPAEGVAAALIERINSSGAVVAAIDIPSGLFSDKAAGEHDPIVNAQFTFTFQFPKLAFMLPGYEKYVGEWYVGDIGLHHDVIEQTPSPFRYVEKEDARRMLKRRSKFAHKGIFGHALLVGGSYGKIGAQVLATKACLKTGAGLVTSYLPKCGYRIIQVSVPEAMAITDPGKKYITTSPQIGSYDAIGVGPGLGRKDRTKEALTELISRAVSPLVIDADGLNILSENPDLLLKVPKNSIFTPHPKEFERLAGKTANDFARLERLRDLAEEYGVYIVLKGAHTAIATPGREVYFNSTGNAGMATGGTGDVLTGIITSLIAQGYEASEAAVLGVYLHGLAGDIAAMSLSQEYMSAGDLIDNLGNAFKELGRKVMSYEL
jgi:hydroxyethylthiazole kinase-like uncharacterized protein yjeF